MLIGESARKSAHLTSAWNARDGDRWYMKGFTEGNQVARWVDEK